MKHVFGFVLLMGLCGILSGYSSIASPINKTSTSLFGNKLSNDPVEGNVAPGMVFPVAGKRSRIGSFWGAIRDGGARKHEGIDIFAAKKTPVLAVHDGIITTVGSGGRGGKYVWLKSIDNRFTYYYAHLDKQLVKPGQRVKKGQQIGTVGNTGNAKLTPPHLHFGMYSYAGAVDPLPFVENAIKLPAKPVSPPRPSVAKTTKKAPAPQKPKISPEVAATRSVLFTEYN